MFGSKKGTVKEGSFVFTGEFSGTLFNTDTNDPTHKMTVQCPGLWNVQGAKAPSTVFAL